MSPGYKQTDVGVIPEEWDVADLRHLCIKIQDGTHFSPQARGGQFLYVTSKNIGFGFLDVSSAPRIDAAQHNEIYRRCDVKKGDLLLTKDGANTGNAALNILNEEFSLLSSVAMLRFDLEHHCPSYFLQQILSWAGQRRIKEAMAGNAITRLTLAKINRLKFPFCKVTEERTIATALSDVDALLAGLDQIIAKKRDLKQAAMQQFLTGHNRLPGFHGEWEVKRLGDYVTFLRNGVNPRADLLLEGRVKYLHYGDVHACKDVYLSPASLPCLPDSKALALDRLRNGDLIFADASEDVAGVSKSVEVRGVGSTQIVAGLHTIAARFDKKVFADGFKGFLQFCPQFATQLRRLAAGTKVYATNRAHVASVEMRLPAIAEQAAIASVLSDMDSELSALEARRDKTRALKQGMMQELLTGRTRLV